MDAERRDCHRQASTFLSTLPTELLDSILADLNTSALLSLRSTCRLASHRVNASFCKLLSSRKYFIHPYSLGLLTALSKSHLAPSVNRIVIGTETFQQTLHLKPEEYAPTITEAFQRFKNLSAVEIRDFSPPDLSDSPRYLCRTPYPLETASDDQPPYADFHTYDTPYHARWGDEPDDLHSQGIAHVTAEYDKPPYPLPRGIEIGKYQQEDLANLFRTVWKSCSIAKELAGVEVKDFRVALQVINQKCGLRDHDFELLETDGDEDAKRMMFCFLQSLEVLHLPVIDAEPTSPTRRLCLFLAACERVKWLRVEFQQGGFGGITDTFQELAETTCVAKWDMDRLDLGCGSARPEEVLDMLALFKPTILNLWDVDLQCQDRLNEDRNLWLEAMHGASQWVEHVRLAHVNQNTNGWLHAHRDQHVHFLPDMGRILELELSRNGEVVQESLVKLDKDIVIRFCYSDWDTWPIRGRNV